LQDDIKFSQIQESLDPDKNRKQIFSSGEAAGASGSFFFFSHDQRFIIKTMSVSERKRMIKMLPDLYMHFKNNPDSLLSRTYGIYTIKMKDFTAVDLLVMANTLRWDKPTLVNRVYDLKGST